MMITATALLLAGALIAIIAAPAPQRRPVPVRVERHRNTQFRKKG
ncbi:hypothetical protein QQG91_05165 [Marivivens sp. LCG002]|nr:hypothetical protein [Marivivens sp. LCG002]WIV51835.1 hypothetical protein QQG91_05165 [Marivivens sp. LCG002]